MRRILVTGATGFIGTHLVSELLTRGHEVIATGTEAFQDVRAPWRERVTYEQFDFHRAPENCFEALHCPDRLIHLAWEGLPNYRELFHFEKNLPASYSLIKRLVIAGLQDVTVLGTCFEYGLRNGSLVEDLDPRPASAYAIAKDTLRRFLEELGKQRPFRLKWVRLFYLHGEGQGKNSILEQLKSALAREDKEFNMSGGEQLRDYLPVATVADYLSRISLHQSFSGIVNCCSGSPISIRRLVDDFLRKQERTIHLNLGFYPYSDLEPLAFWGNTDRLTSLLETSEVFA